MIELLLPWIICVVFVVVGALIFLDSRRTEKLVDYRHELLDIREQEVEAREANVQKLLSDGRATAAVLRRLNGDHVNTIREQQDEILALRERLLAIAHRNRR